MGIEDLRGKCLSGSGERCDLHFIVENEVIQTKDRVVKLEQKADKDRETMMSDNRGIKGQLEKITNMMSANSIEQKFKDESAGEIKTKTIENQKEITGINSSLRDIEHHHETVASTLTRIDTNLTELSSEFRQTKQAVVEKGTITEIVQSAIVADKNIGRDRWFESLPAKISAGVALLSLIAFFTVKIVLLLLGAPIG